MKKANRTTHTHHPPINKILILITITILIAEVVSAITTISPETVYQGGEITLTIRPNKKSGFYNIIYVMQDTEVVDLIMVPCEEVCKQQQTIIYTVPQTFLGEYYFATFDYKTNDYELDYFNVIEQGGASGGSMKIITIKNFDSPDNFLINPIQGQRANTIIETEFKTANCQNYEVYTYLCNETLYSTCSEIDYTYKIQMQLDSKVRRACHLSYTGADYFTFYESSGTWKIIAKSGTVSDEKDFSISSLSAVYYPNFISFGTLNAEMWNTGAPSGGTDLINWGNIPVSVDWNCSQFNCITSGCTDFWLTFDQGENRFQIDDEDLFMEPIETGLDPVYITDFSVNYFPQTPIPTCTSDLCDSGSGEKITTYYNLKIPKIQKGKYQGNLVMRIS